jgi:lipoprotein-anchoring transpeptidase ErfK/SrfK
MSQSPQFRRPLTVLAMAGLGSILLAACSPNAARPAGSQAQGAGAGAAPTTSAPPDISVAPADGAHDVRLDTAVTVKADGGALDSVVVHPAGDTSTFLTGTLADGSRTWTSTGALDAGTSYLVEVTAHGAGGDQSSAHSSFTTMTPKRLTTDTQPSDGETVGIAMPISLRFNAPVAADKQAALVSHLQVTTNPPVDGAWHWFAPDEVHFRPKDYWAPGTKVTLNAHLRGVDAGNDVWGQGDWTLAFTVGEKHVSTIDAAAHNMVVTANDKTLYTWPVSVGRPRNPTIQGNLVVWYKQYDVLMDSQTIGIPRHSPDGYYEHVYWDTAISTDGFFVHSAPWSEWAQGSQNVSHGCVNLSPSRAETFYKFSQKGDLVVVKNTGHTADASDGEGDWQIPFAQYANSGGAATPAATAQPGGL